PEYGAYLCHRAVTTDGSDGGGTPLDLLRAAAALLPAGHAVHRHVTGLDRDDRMEALLAALFPTAVPDLERRGRYRALEEAAERYPALWSALERDEPTAIQRELTALVEIGAPDLAVPHTLAVLHREEALGGLARTGTPSDALTAATALWTLLLAHPAFWAHVGIDDAESTQALRRELTDELLDLHRVHGARALDSETRDPGPYLRCLTAVREGPDATRALLAGGPAAAAVPDGVDADLFAYAADRAERLVGSWADDLVAEAGWRADDPDALERLPVGVDRDFEAAIAVLDAAIERGFAPVPVLTGVVGLYNEWQDGLREINDWDGAEEILRKAGTHVERLAAQSTENQPHRKANQVLGHHFLVRALCAGYTQESLDLLDRAKAWDPLHRWLVNVTDRHVRQIVYLPVREHITARRYGQALEILDGIEVPDADIPGGVRRSHMQLRVKALYWKGLDDLDARELDTAEECLREALELSPEIDNDPNLVPRTNKALSKLLTYRASDFVTAAATAPADDTEALVGLMAAKGLLRDALDLDPANRTAADTMTRAEESIRRFLR
ncbi:hypothetical protein GTW43_12705, partial [Streptomyces sp. SID5785]|uniref:hypothetical protein n=1 Tax=Streptomyces sp. SID5785 TaxID=2690309 RepID=UPI001360ED7F